MKKNKRGWVAQLIIWGGLCGVFGLVACQPERPAEQAGKKIDRANALSASELQQTSEYASAKINAAEQSVAENMVKSRIHAQKTVAKTGLAIDQHRAMVSTGAAQETEIAGAVLHDTESSIISAAATAGAYINDALTTAKLKTAIYGDSMLRASNIQVSTLNNVVILDGTVDSEQSIGRVLGLASNQSDVLAVEIKLTVVEPSP
ncbi:MAG: BON domain-containing protein [Methylococcales bacterium]|nr:BON domain-containing protein [Methylococcales bacterium]